MMPPRPEPISAPFPAWQKGHAACTEEHAAAHLRVGVRAALLALGQGVLDANAALRDAVVADGHVLSCLFEELLRVVCRLAFLAGLEARGLLPAPRAEACPGHSFSRWLALACAPEGGAGGFGAWDGMRHVLGAMDAGDPERGLPALGAEPGGLALVMAARMADRDFLSAIRSLGCSIGEGRQYRPIDWRSVRSGDLAGVYEGLLETRPCLAPDGRLMLDEAGRGNDRRISGSYYTPDSLVQALLDSALDPVIDRAVADGGAEGVLALRIIDPACGGGHFLLGAARRMAARLAALRAPGRQDYQTALRDVVARCIHGVDCNPMAVELTRMALWIETAMPGRPLCFLGANIRCGNALLGVADVAVLEAGVPDGAYRALGNDDPAVVRHCLRRNQREKGDLSAPDCRALLAPFVAELSVLREMPEETTQDVARKQQCFEAWWTGVAGSTLGRACDLYVAAFMLPRPAGSQADMVPTTARLWQEPAGAEDAGYMDAAIHAASAARALHWPLVFADIMTSHGGFDVVIGNPPWDVMQLEEEEYFGTRMSAISALKGAARKAAITALGTARPDLFARFAHARRQSEAMGVFVRAGGRFPLAGRGKGNTYALFTELSLALVRPDGRAGLVVPTGIATDAMTAPLLGHLVEERRLAQLVDFENSAPLFPGVHRSFKFCLLTIANAVAATRFACFLTRTQQCGDTRRGFSLSAENIARLNPNTRTMPVFRSRMDAALTCAIYARVHVFVDEARGPAGNPWDVEFRQGLFNMTSDSRLFRTAAQLAGGGWRRDGTDWVHPGRMAQGAPDGGDGSRYVPLYEAKMGYFYDHRHAGYGRRRGERGHRVLPQTGPDEHCDPAFEVTPHYWVPHGEVMRKAGHAARAPAFFGFRNIMSPTNERTFICNLLPPWGVGNSMTLLSPGMGWSDPRTACLIANLSSLPFDFVCRQKAGGVNLNFFIVRQLPVLPPSFYSAADVEFILPRVLELTFTSNTMAPFARAMGHAGPPFAWDEARRALLRAELDAWYAHAYGLGRRQLEYVLDPHDVMGADYPSQTFRVLRKNEMAAFGEYRTRRIVLAAYDRQKGRAPRPAS
ncbi:Eco57I restriction-modification methylase domain-containing protein [Novacetimonas maltaceti]|nr:N-6 DNA methylase [Novacetimonas maltaceti]